MEQTTPASRDALYKLETVVRIRERIVRVTAEALLEAIDRSEPIDHIVDHLREAVAEAIVADDAYASEAFGSTGRLAS